MDRDKLQILLNDKMLKKASHIDVNEKNKMFQKIYESCQRHKGYEDIMAAIEEMAELTQVLSKLERGKIKLDDIGIIEEIADVRLSMHQIRYSVFNVLMSCDDVAMESCCKKDKSTKSDKAIITAMKRMSKLSNELSKTILGKDCSKSKVMNSIVKVEASIAYVICDYALNEEAIRYVEDIKIEREKAGLEKDDLI